MRENLPVNDHEILFPSDPEAKIISTTDPRGIITDVNETFLQISGFTREELIGKPHNIVRHPDMPSAVFAAMWAELKEGRPFIGMIKNRCKDGSFYWVSAFIIPIIIDGRITGYESVRTRPDPKMIQRATNIYAAMRSGKKLRLATKDFFSQGLNALAISAAAAAIAYPVWYTTAAASVLALAAYMRLHCRSKKFVEEVASACNAQSDSLTLNVYAGGTSDVHKAYMAMLWKDKYADTVLTRVKEACMLLSEASQNNLDEASRNNDEMQRKFDKTSDTVNRMSMIADDITSMMNDLMDSINKTVHDTDEAQEQAAHGKAASDRTLTAINALDESSKKVAATIDELAQQVSKVSESIELIDTVSSQTNLLALNASIEAARAGTYGKGFAVVADEVRALSLRTHDSATDIHKQLEAFMSKTGEAHELSTASKQDVISGVNEVQQSHEVLNEVQKAINGIKATSDMMMNTIREKAETAKAVSGEVRDLIKLSEENVGISGKTRDEMQKLSEKADDLSEMVLRFNQGIKHI